ncbi:MAG: deoxyribodipyrimidine photolyase, partial [Planctomycetota bacterium]|nr:deoxyribodipyrimidine photolyase [Planctomycetota bacterium]
MVPKTRINIVNPAELNDHGDFVLYWMTAYRRASFNFALDRAIEISNLIGKPILVYEPLRSNYRWACDRFHQFLLE